MEEASMYEVNGTKFDSFLKAVAVAKLDGSKVIESSNGMERWTPAPVRKANRTIHVLVNADGTKTPFGKVRN
jgi:hypothetical protein